VDVHVGKLYLSTYMCK